MNDVPEMVADRRCRAGFGTPRHPQGYAAPCELGHQPHRATLR
jgi:hypothetical protein